MKCKICARELYFYLPTGMYFHNTGDKLDHEAVVDKEAPAAEVLVLRNHQGAVTQEPPAAAVERAPVEFPVLAPRQRRLARHARLARRTAAWEALGMIRKHYPWRLIPTIPLGKQ
jgi:hypothetical protein